jgi:hypothetical protein
MDGWTKRAYLLQGHKTDGSDFSATFVQVGDLITVATPSVDSKCLGYHELNSLEHGDTTYDFLLAEHMENLRKIAVKPEDDTTTRLRCSGDWKSVAFPKQEH